MQRNQKQTETGENSTLAKRELWQADFQDGPNDLASYTTVYTVYNYPSP